MNKLFSLLLLTMACAVQAAEPPHDMQKMWQAMLARPALAVTAAFDDKGRLWRAQVRDGHLWVSRSDDLGASYGDAVQVNPEPEAIAADGENRPKLVARGAAVYVSYTLSREQPMTGDIRFSRSLDGGRSFSAPITVNDNREVISHRFDALAVNGKGQVYLAWLDKREQSAARKAGAEYAGAALYYAVSDDGGASFRRNIKLADHTCECCRTAMALDSDGVPVVAWRHIYDGNIRDHAIARLDGKALAQRLGRENWNVAACPHHGPALSIAADGVYHAAWFSNAPEQRGLFYASSGDRGRTFTAPLNFGKAAAQAAHPAVLSRGRDVYLAWKEFDGEQTHIVVMRSLDGGKVWSVPRRLASTADASDSPQLLEGKGRVYLSWNSLVEGHRLLEVIE
ncbi:MAG TPA: sialidase family protein [Sideroxyarcus sp.]|nr:sialidase family protein [Sideroxyarcus sp.]